MSSFVGMQAQLMFAEANSKPSSARSSTNKLEVTPAKARASSSGAAPSQSSTPVATPPLRALKQSSHMPPIPPLPGPRVSPRRVALEGKTHAASGTTTAAHSRSPSASSSDSDDDFVYILDSVKTTEEAVERIRAVQQPKSSSNNLAELADTSPGKPQAAAAVSPAPPRKMRGGLPATMEEFYECPRYTVSLTAAREAIFSDALSGFHSYVERENAQREQLRMLQHEQQQHHSRPGHSTPNGKEEDHGGSDSSATNKTATAHALPSFSSGATEEWNAALAATTPHPEKRLLATTTAAAVVDPPTAPTSEAASTPMRSSGDQLPGGATTNPSSPSLAGVAATTMSSGKDNSEAGAQPLSASHMFIMRSRDTEAMSPISSPRANPQFCELAELRRPEEGGAASPATNMSPLEERVAATTAHADPAASETAAGAPPPIAKPTSPLKATPDRVQGVKLESMQLQTLLRERTYQRNRVPVVFRCRYAAEFAETREEHQQRLQMRERVMRHHERIAGPGGMTHAMRRHVRERYGNPNTVAPEWPYVWEQFVRDIPRETLFVEDTAHRDADDALAAIMSYLEYCYDRAQQNVKERLDKALADASEGGIEGATAAEKEGATTGTAKEELGSPTAATPPPPPPPATNTKGFFESLFSAGSAAIKGAVVAVRAGLPDFVGDPLLTVSGLDPALYHTSLLFPSDPKLRSEKIFNAVREVVLASQQSFMGFPYQLLCEQVGIERLGLALEALENDQDGDNDDDEGEGEGTASQASGSATIKTQSTTDASASIPIRRSDDADTELRREVSTSLIRSPMSNSRVVRIYQSFSSPKILLDNAEGCQGRRHRGHAAHGIDEWNVSSSSDTSSPSHATDVICSPASPADSASGAEAAAAVVYQQPAATPPASHNVESPKKTKTDSATSEKSLPAATRPPPLQSLTHNAGSAAHPAPPIPIAAKPPDLHHASSRRLAQRRRERRRRRRNQLPLLIGEPRPHEFAIFLDMIKARFAAKIVKEEKKAKERQRRDRALWMVERQREQWHSAPGSRAASSTSLETMAKPSAPADAAPVTVLKLFREDVEGSAYLLPSQPATAEVVATSPLSSMPSRQAIPVEARGMRICVLFDAARNVPVVIVNKLFRLFTMPGLRGLTSSSSDEEGEQQQQPLKAHERAALETWLTEPGGEQDTEVKGPSTKHSEKSLLLLIQVQFSLFTKEEAEVRWKWWKV